VELAPPPGRVPEATVLGHVAGLVTQLARSDTRARSCLAGASSDDDQLAPRGLCIYGGHSDGSLLGGLLLILTTKIANSKGMTWIVLGLRHGTDMSGAQLHAQTR
jgi:hypothetical protein